VKVWWVLAAVLLATACGAPEPEAGSGLSAEAPGPRVPAPDFTLPDIAGNPVQLSDFRGKTVILDFWATWCPPCVYQVPGLNRLQAAHAETGDLVVIGISVDIDGVEVVEPWVHEEGVAYTIVMGDEKLAREFGAQGFPALVAVSPDGSIEAHHDGRIPAHHGVIDYDDLEEIAAKAAASRPL